MNALITDYAWPSLNIEREILTAAGINLTVAETGDEAELIELAQAHDPVAILTNWKTVSVAVLDAAPNCKIVARYGVGIDNIDVQGAAERGITVTNVPDYCMDDVADHTMGLILACARNIVALAADTRAGGWDLHASGRPFARLRGKTLGLVGFGLIAQAIVPRALAFGLHVIAYTPRLTADRVPAGVEATNDLDTLLARSDYVSLNLPATAETHHLVDRLFLSAMKPSAYLINTSRGSVVDEAALINACQTGLIRGAALDVLEVEAPDSNPELMRLENVIVTPHAAFYSPASIAELQRKAAEEVVAVLQGKEPKYRIV